LAEAWIEAVWLRDDKCLAAAERALALYQKVNDTMGTLEADWMAGRALLLLGRFEEGKLRLNRVLETSKALDVAKLTATILISLGSFGNDYHRMASYFDEALRISKAIGAERLAGVAAINRAEAEFRDGNALGALQLAEEGRYAPSLGRDVMEAEYLANTAAYLVALGRYEEARERARAALPLKFEMQSEYGSLSTIQHLAAVAALDQNYNTECTLERQRRAARLLGYIDARYTALDTHRQPTEQQEYDKMLPALRAAFTDDEVTHLMHEGGVWGEEEAIGQALQV
jgi:tetratricopeptide (TPR) repeat protein